MCLFFAAFIVLVSKNVHPAARFGGSRYEQDRSRNEQTCLKSDAKKLGSDDTFIPTD